MLLKGRVESSLLSNDEPLTPIIDKIWQFDFLEGRLKTQKMANIGLLDSVFSVLGARQRKFVPENFNWEFGTRHVFLIAPIKIRSAEPRGKYLLNFVQPISQPILGPCILENKFDCKF